MGTFVSPTFLTLVNELLKLTYLRALRFKVRVVPLKTLGRGPPRPSDLGLMMVLNTVDRFSSLRTSGVPPSVEVTVTWQFVPPVLLRSLGTFGRTLVVATLVTNLKQRVPPLPKSRVPLLELRRSAGPLVKTSLKDLASSTFPRCLPYLWLTVTFN